MAFLTQATWDRYKAIINEVHEDFNQDTITWRRFLYGLQPYGEDTSSNETYVDIDLKVLIAYNYFRTWPVTDFTPTGELDKESMVAIFNIAYLRSIGYINTNNNFIMDPGKDLFIHQGVEYTPSGETPTAQANDEPLLLYIILKRSPVQSGKPIN